MYIEEISSISLAILIIIYVKMTIKHNFTREFNNFKKNNQPPPTLPVHFSLHKQSEATNLRSTRHMCLNLRRSHFLATDLLLSNSNQMPPPPPPFSSRLPSLSVTDGKIPSSVPVLAGDQSRAAGEDLRRMLKGENYRICRR